MSVCNTDKSQNPQLGVVATPEAPKRAAESTESHSLVLRLPDEGERSSHLHCGSCHQPIDDPGTGHSTRCAQCGRHLAVPSLVGIKCARCGHHQSIPSRELATERVCAKCGATVAVPDIELSPRHHQQQRQNENRHASRHSRRISKHADAAWAVLIIGLTLVIALLALTLL